MPGSADALAALKELSREWEELQGRAISRVAFPLDPLGFHRDFVAASRPCIITGAIDDWPALSKWTREYLSNTFQDTPVPVSATPTGRADAVAILPGTEQAVFALPAEGSMRMGELLQHIADPPAGGGNVLYSQQQNDCLRRNFQRLLPDVEVEPAWATHLFGGPPEAVNIWIGGARSATTFHKDPYENLFAVVAGVKTFTLLPPPDGYRLSLQQYPVARYAAEPGADLRHCELQLRLEDPPASTRWSPIDPTCRLSSAGYPLFADFGLPAPRRVTVRAGEVLFLPSLWQHFVEQVPGPDGVCIACNWWYEMAVDARFAYFGLAERLAASLGDAG